MIRTLRNIGACWLAIGLAVAAQEGHAQRPFERGIQQAAPGQEEKLRAPPKVVVTSPRITDVVVTQPYACQIHAQRHIEVRALEPGPLVEVPIKEGQAVKQGDILFRVTPILYKAKLEVELAEVKLAQLEFANTKKLFDQKVVAQQEVALSEAKLARAQARAKLAQFELNFTEFRAPFDGFIGRVKQQQGSLVEKGDILTTLSDNSVMWVYFYVPETRYLEYQKRYKGEGSRLKSTQITMADSRIELQLADGSIFGQTVGNTVTVEPLFDNKTSNIAFRADVPNPDRLLQHGQTGTIMIRRTVKNATVIPHQATFEVFDRRFVYVVGKDNVVRMREVVVRHELDDIFVIQKGLDATDRIVLEGIRQLRDGDTVESVYRKPDEPAGRPKADEEK